MNCFLIFFVLTFEFKLPQIAAKKEKKPYFSFSRLFFLFAGVENSLLLNQIRLTKYELFVVSWQQELVDVVVAAAVDAVDAVVVVGLR